MLTIGFVRVKIILFYIGESSMDCGVDYRWFSKITWEERDQTVDCLVDVGNNLLLPKSYWLIRKCSELFLVRSTVAIEWCIQESDILGQAIRWAQDL